MLKIFRKISVAIFLCAIFATAAPALAHQPRIVAGERTEIEDPEVPQAFYGELFGGPAFYEIKSEKPFNFYFNLLVPDLPGQAKDFSARVVLQQEGAAGRVIYNLDGQNFDWQPYFEKFAGSHYFKGPEWGKNLEGGDYLIAVYSPSNSGKYVLAIGEKESFSPGEILKTLLTLPKLKKDFWGKSAYTAYFNLVGLFSLIFLIIFAGLAVAAVLAVKKKKKK